MATMKCLTLLLFLFAAAMDQASTQCPTSNTTSNTSSLQPGPCTEPSTTGCGQIYDFTNATFPGLAVSVYVFTDQEKNGTCKRGNVQYTNSPFLFLQDTTPDNCLCEDAACKTCIENNFESNATDQKCCGTPFFSYLYNDKPFTVWDNTTKRPTCCPVVNFSNGIFSDTCYCEPQTSECFNYCPAVRPAARIVGGTVIESCGTGVVRLSIRNNVICNGIYAYNPSGKDSTAALLTKPVIYVPKECLKGIRLLLNNPLIKTNITVTIGNHSTPYTLNNVVTRPAENEFFEILEFKTPLLSPCMAHPVCTYNNATMANVIDKNACRVLSFGADEIDANGIPVFSGNLSQLPIFQVGSIGACRDGTGTASECYFPNNVAAFTCTGDLGAPVLCNTLSKESVLYGAFAQTTKCNTDNKLFPVQPITL